tara:strand:+ start:90 stop:341 length:252 start_codon:yes stop_codon:yes gene_type:complete
MFFGATAFSATTFAGVGIQNVVVLPNGNRMNIAIGNTTIDLITTVPVTGQHLKLATNTVDVISWIPIDPNATGVWVPIDPNNP